MTDWQTKRVRAYNVRIGDELLWFDANAKRGVVMYVSGFDLSFPGVQRLFLRRRKRGKATYRWHVSTMALVRVRREAKR